MARRRTSSMARSRTSSALDLKHARTEWNAWKLRYARPSWTLIP